MVTDKQAIVTATGQTYTDALTVAENVITLESIGNYTAGITKIGTVGSVQFKLEYVPFNVTDDNPNPWTDYNGKSFFDLSGNKEPVWIIRNGINDEAQDEYTDFTGFGADTGKNGNGAVSYVVAADGPPDPANPQTGDLVIRDGKFVGPVDSTEPEISYITGGYEGTAEVYYAVVPVPVGKTTSAPAYSAYTDSLEAVAATIIPADPNLPPEPHTKKVSLSGTGNYDIYVVLFQDGKVSTPVKINTKKGGGVIDWGWSPDYMVLVEGGTFTMGSPTMEADRSPNQHEKQHLVTVSSFYMSMYEVSQAEYKLFKQTHVSGFTGDKLPVEDVTWYEAVEYCN
jgi:hypothetical protein